MGFITTDGENKIAVKQGANQTLAITHFVLANIAGLGAEPVNRIEAMPAGGNIMATLPVTRSGYVNGNQVVYSLVMDSSIGDYDFNWVGLKDADGVLIACAHVPLIQKRKTAGAIPGNNLTRNFLIAYSGIQATTAIDVPAETWQIDFNARLWGIDERERLSNYDIYGHEAFLADGWKVVRQGATTTYDITPGVGYVGGIRIASAITQQVTVAGPPKSIWLDVSLQGDISDVSAVADFIIDAVGHADYTDGNGFNHYVTKIANIAADGSVTDVRVTGGDWATVPYVQKVAGGVLAKSVAGGVDVVLTDLECENGILKLTGAITANINVIVKSSPTRKWIIENSTTGAFALTVKTAAGTGVELGSGATDIVWTDGVNVYDALSSINSTGFQGATKNLNAYSTGLDANYRATADEIVLEDSNNKFVTRRNLFLTVNTAAAGVNALDAGAVAASSWYSLWAIYNKTTNTDAAVAVLVPTLTGNTTLNSAVVTSLAGTAQMHVGMPIRSANFPAGTVIKTVDSGTQVTMSKPASATTAGVNIEFVYSPVMPAGYTFKALIDCLRTDGTANKYPLSFISNNDGWRYVVKAGSNVTAMPQMASGSQGSMSTPTWVAVGVGAFVPPTATVICLSLCGTGDSGTGVMAAPNNSYGAVQGLGVSQVNPPPLASSNYANNSSARMAISGEFLLESSSIYYAAGNVQDAMFCTGWR